MAPFNENSVAVLIGRNLKNSNYKSGGPFDNGSTFCSYYCVKLINRVDNIDIKTHKVNDRWELFTLVNDIGMEAQFLNYGGIIIKILVPDKNNNTENIVLGYSDYQDYESDQNYLLYESCLWYI